MQPNLNGEGDSQSEETIELEALPSHRDPSTALGKRRPLRSQLESEEIKLSKLSSVDEEDPAKEARRYLDYVVQARVDGKTLNPIETEKLYEIQCKYGISYVHRVIEYEARLAEGKNAGSPPKYFVMEERFDKAALGKRCLLTGQPASGGRDAYYRYDEARQEEHKAWLAKCMVGAGPDEAQMKIIINQERMSKINKTRLVNSGREEAQTDLQRQWASRGLPKRMQRTGEEKEIETLLNEMVKKTVRAVRDGERHLEKKLKKDGSTLPNPK